MYLHLHLCEQLPAALFAAYACVEGWLDQQQCLGHCRCILLLWKTAIEQGLAGTVTQEGQPGAVLPTPLWIRLHHRDPKLLALHVADSKTQSWRHAGQ